MTELYWGVSALLLATVAAGLWRFFLGPTAADRLMVTQLFGTTGVAVCLLLSVAMGSAAILDVALALGLLSVVTTAAFIRFYWSQPTRLAERRKVDGQLD
jgi:multicomponent Na+:H+ antiporter subunit F